MKKDPDETESRGRGKPSDEAGSLPADGSAGEAGSLRGAGPPGDPDGLEGELRFEEALDRLETLVEEMESGDLALEETIARFEEGQKLLRTCGQLLDRAEQRVRTILKRADGALTAEPWDAEEAEGDEGR